MTAVAVERLFWLKWTGFVTAGAAAGYLGVTVIIELVGGPESFGVPFQVAFPMTLGLIGTVVGLMQSLLLRRYAVGVAAWILASAIGFTIAFVVDFNYVAPGDDLPRSNLSGTARGALVGAVAGVAQGLVIRRHYRMPGWLLANVVGWAAAGAARDLTGVAEGGPVDLLGGFLIAGVVTGAAMAQLLRHPVKKST